MSAGAALLTVPHYEQLQLHCFLHSFCTRLIVGVIQLTNKISFLFLFANDQSVRVMVKQQTMSGDNKD